MKYLSLHNLKMTSFNEDFCIHCEHLNSIEATLLLEAVKDSSKVKELIMTGLDLSNIDEELLFQTVLNLKSVSFIGGLLTTEQLTSIISAATLSESLQSLNLSSNNLSEVSSELLVRATARLEVLGLEFSSLTQEQCIAIIKGATTSSTLRFINYNSINLVGTDRNVSTFFTLLKEAKKKEDLYIKLEKFNFEANF